MNPLPLLALTMGDPAGIGPELAVRAAADAALQGMARMVVYGCPEVIQAAADRFSPGFQPRIKAVGSLPYSAVKPGELQPDCGVAAMNAVMAAVNDALNGQVDAVVTAPMNKAAVNRAGIVFTGHTELIASMCGVEDYAMMQSDGPLRVAFVTTHIPLNRVAEEISSERIVRVAELLHESCVAEGIASPLLAAAAINPHAGENGYMGSEDEDIVKPALEELRGLGIRIDGPFPPDTLFIASTLRRYDGVVSMYHDQGHIPFKMLAFDRGVNSTLGLPIIRTSPDHGTAFEIAWRGVADTGSFFAAVRLAARRAVHAVGKRR